MALWMHSTIFLDGQASDPVPVLSGVPQGSIVSQVLFFIFINDLLDNIRSSVCLFAVECVLTSLGHWEAYWQMKFNVAKCHSMRVTRHQHHKQTLFHYSLHNHTLENVQSPNTLVSPLLITWIEISMSQKSLPNQLRHLVFFAGTCLLHLAVPRKLHTKLLFGLN